MFRGKRGGAGTQDTRHVYYSAPVSVQMAPVAGLRLDVASRRVTRDRAGAALRKAVGRNQLGSPRAAERAVARGAEQVGPAGPRAIESRL